MAGETSSSATARLVWPQLACRPGSVTTLPVTWEHSPNMPPDLLFCLSWLLIVSDVFSASRGTETELADARR